MSAGAPLPPQRRTAAVAGAAVVFVGGLVCVLWVLGMPEATRLVAASSAVRFNTGLSFVFAGIGLLLTVGPRPRWALAALVPMLVLAGSTLAEYAFGRSLGVDDLFVQGRALPHPGRMAPNTAVALVVAGFGLAALVPGRKWIWALSIAAMLATLTTVLALVAMLGYAFDLTAAFTWAGLTSMALLTAITLAVLGVGVLLAAREIGRTGSWFELPWLATSVGVGAAGVGLLAVHAFAAEAPWLPPRVLDGLYAAALVVAVLLAGTVAQARHMRLMTRALGAVNRRLADHEQALRDSQKRLQQVLDRLQTAVVVHAGDSSIELANPSAAALLGLTREQMLGRTAIDPAWRFVREDGSPMPVDDYPVSRVLRTGEALRDYVVGIEAAAGAPVRWALVDAVPVVGDDGGVRQVIVSFVDISQRQQRKQQLEQMAATDVLTGLATRRHLTELAGHELARARRSGRTLSVVLCDIDHFKAVNDRYGHETGDQVLQRVARALHAGLRESDLAARWGGEEFLLLLPDTDARAAAEIAERLRAAVEHLRLVAPDGSPLPVTASFGIAQSNGGDDDLHRLVDAADQAMYRAKRGGRNRVRVDGDEAATA